MHRRTYLATAAAAIGGIAGCVEDVERGSGGRTTDGTSTGDDPPTTTAEPTHADDPSVTVGDVALHHGYVAPSSPDSIGIHDEERQYLVAEVTVDGDLERDEIALRAGDASFSPVSPDRFYRTGWADESWYEAGDESGLVLFSPSAAPDAGEIRLVWPGGEHAIGGSIPDRLGAGVPSFTAAFDLPDTVAGATAPPVEIEVTNDEGIERRFLAAVNRTGPSIAYTPLERVSRLVEPGETETIVVGDSWYDGVSDDRVGDGEADVTYHLLWAGGEASADIRIVEDE